MATIDIKPATNDLLTAAYKDPAYAGYEDKGDLSDYLIVYALNRLAALRKYAAANPRKSVKKAAKKTAKKTAKKAAAK